MIDYDTIDNTIYFFFCQIPGPVADYLPSAVVGT
jgi:hypothetical protein